MKIAIVVHGRFHAFDLARALLGRGHEVTLFTNYPRWAAKRFGVPGHRVRSFWVHGVLSRAAARLCRASVARRLEPWLHAVFGRWASRGLEKERWDVVHVWSGVAEESHHVVAGGSTPRLLMRGSAHIRAQARLLEEEERRVGVALDRPSPWMIAREEREYALADRLVVLSTFAYDTFVAEGVLAERLRLLPLGARLDAFRPPRRVVEDRGRRILSGEPLRILCVGAVSFQKGLWDLAAVVRQLGGEGFQFRVVGPRLPEAAILVSELRAHATFAPKQPQARLPAVYAWGDVFVFPTIQDGYAQVLAQAAASALPILTTTNCSGPDLVREGQTGWVVPVRSSEALTARLRWCDGHRDELAAMVWRIYDDFRPRDWADVAADFEVLCEAELSAGAQLGP